MRSSPHQGEPFLKSMVALSQAFAGSVARKSSSSVTDPDSKLMDWQLAEAKDDPPVDPTIPRLLRSMSRGMHYQCRVAVNTVCGTNSSTGKYLGFFASSTTLKWGALSNNAEFSALDTLFDEVFIRAVTIRYLPRNRYQGMSSTIATDLNNCAGTIVGMPHATGVYTDSSGAWAAMVSATQHRVINTADPFTFRMTNPESFSWNGPLGDQSTSASTMSWCILPNVGTYYGGYFQWAFAAATATSAAPTTLVASAVLGDMMVYWDIALRARA